MKEANKNVARSPKKGNIKSAFLSHTTFATKHINGVLILQKRNNYYHSTDYIILGEIRDKKVKPISGRIFRIKNYHFLPCQLTFTNVFCLTTFVIFCDSGMIN